MSQTLITLIRSGDVERVRALLRLLSTQPTDEITYSEISNRLKLGTKSLSQIVNEPDESGLSPLYWAVAQNEPAGSILTEILLQHGASMTELDVRSGFTPVHLAAYLPHKEALEVLLKQETTRSIALNVRTPNGATPLHLAARRGHFEIVQMLLQRGADPLARDAKGATPLQYTKDSKIQTLLLDAMFPVLVELMSLRGTFTNFSKRRIDSVQLWHFGCIDKEVEMDLNR